MKRIVEETLVDGSIQYRVETNKKFFGLFTCRWHTDSTLMGEPGCSIRVYAVFKTIEEAEIFAFGKPKGKKIVKRTVLNYSN